MWSCRPLTIIILNKYDCVSCVNFFKKVHECFNTYVYICISQEQTSPSIRRDTTDTTAETAFVPYNVTPVMTVTHQQLSLPWGVAIHPQSGDVYATSFGDSALCTFNGKIYNFISYTRKWKTPNDTVISLSRPTGITIAPDGRLIIAEDSRIIIIKDGTVIKSWGLVGQSGSGLGEFSGIYDIALGESGLIYVTDHRNDRVQVIDPITSDIKIFHDDMPGHPTAVTINPVNGDILVAGEQPPFVQVFDAHGRSKNLVSLSYVPRGLFVDPRGFIFVTDITNEAIRIYDPMWNEAQSFGQYGICPSCFYNPVGIAVNSQNEDLLVMDHSNSRIQIFRKITRP